MTDRVIPLGTARARMTRKLAVLRVPQHIGVVASVVFE